MLKKRSTAMAILAAVLVLGTLFGTHRSLSGKQAEVVESFYHGTGGDDYGIQNKLEQRSDKAKNLVKIAANYDVEDARQAVNDACTELDQAKSAGDCYAANEALTEAAEVLSQALIQAGLTAEDENYRSGLMADLNSYQLQLERLAGDYNAEVREFNQDILGGFPAGLLGGITGIREVEAFE